MAYTLRWIGYSGRQDGILGGNVWEVGAGLSGRRIGWRWVGSLGTKARATTGLALVAVVKPARQHIVWPSADNRPDNDHLLGSRCDTKDHMKSVRTVPLRYLFTSFA